jgi:hypothetical protein
LNESSHVRGLTATRAHNLDDFDAEGVLLELRAKRVLLLHVVVVPAGKQADGKRGERGADGTRAKVSPVVVIVPSSVAVVGSVVVAAGSVSTAADEGRSGRSAACSCVTSAATAASACQAVQNQGVSPAQQERNKPTRDKLTWRRGLDRDVNTL